MPMVRLRGSVVAEDDINTLSPPKLALHRVNFRKRPFSGRIGRANYADKLLYLSLQRLNS